MLTNLNVIASFLVILWLTAIPATNGSITGQNIIQNESARIKAFVSGRSIPVRDLPPPFSDVTVIQNNKRLSFDCRGGSANISGNKNTITLRGECARLLVNGNSNIITVESVAEITASGNNNRISWAKSPSGDEPQINSPGSGNVITQRK